MVATATTSPSPSNAISAFDEVFVEPAPRGAARPAALVDTPTGWRHAPLVAWLGDQSRERRETLLAIGFAVLAGIWAPLGIVAFLSRELTLFLALSLVALVLLTAPRPALEGAGAGLRAQVRPALARVRPALAEVRGQVRPALASARDRVGPGIRALRAWSRDQVGRSRVGATTAWSWARARFEEFVARARVHAAAWEEAGQRAGARSTQRDPVLSDPLSRWIGDQRTPSSTR